MASVFALRAPLRAVLRGATTSLRGEASTLRLSQARFTSQHSSAHAPAGGKLLRSANPGLRATIFGAYGFVGRYVTALLAAGGVQCIIPFRGDDMEWRHLKVMGDVGVVVPMPFSPRDARSIARAVEGSDIVINLCGKDHETRHYLPWLTNFSYEDVNVTLAAALARAAVDAGATTLIHVSALAADPHSASRWALTKAAGERAVRAVAPGATIVRPADVFGPEDRFLNTLARLHALFPALPLVRGGAARVQPLFVNDLARAVAAVALSEDPAVMLGQTYDLAGPDEYTLREVAEYVFEQTRATEPSVAPLSPLAADALGAAMSALHIGLLAPPIMTRDKFARWSADVVLDDMAPTKRLADLGIEATSMEAPGFNWLHRFRSGSHFLDMPGAAGAPTVGAKVTDTTFRL